MQFPLLYGGTTLLGRPLDRTVTNLNVSSLTSQQVTFMYRDIAVVMSLLAQDATEIRPGGADVQTAHGPGLLYRDAERHQLTVFQGRIVLTVHGPTEAVVRAAAADLHRVP